MVDQLPQPTPLSILPAALLVPITTQLFLLVLTFEVLLIHRSFQRLVRINYY